MPPAVEGAAVDAEVDRDLDHQIGIEARDQRPLRTLASPSHPARRGPPRGMGTRASVNHGVGRATTASGRRSGRSASSDRAWSRRSMSRSARFGVAGDAEAVGRVRVVQPVVVLERHGVEALEHGPIDVTGPDQRLEHGGRVGRRSSLLVDRPEPTEVVEAGVGQAGAVGQRRGQRLFGHARQLADADGVEPPIEEHRGREAEGGRPG